MKPENNSLFKETINMAWPAVVESFFVAFVGLVDSYMVSGLGSNAVAAIGLTTQPKFMGLSMFFAINVSLSALVARRRGEDKREDANRILVSGIAFILIAAVIISTLLVVFGGHALMSAFFEEPEIVKIGVDITRIIIVVVIFQVSQVIYMGCLRGAGDTGYTAMASIISVTIIRTAFSYMFGYILGFGINGVWLGILADQVSRFIFGSVRFKQGNWTKIKI